jgi:FAD/FMN-containing dehydrogenase
VTSSELSRRVVVQGAAIGAVGLLAGCSAAKTTTGRGPRPPTSSTSRSTPSTSSSPSTVSDTPAGAPPASAWKALAGALDGDLVRPGDPDYPDAKELFNPRWDVDRPVAVVEAANADDVATALAFAQKYEIPIRPKAGGHSYVGASCATGAMVISVSRLTAVSYDSSTQTASVGAGAKLYPVHAALAAHGRTIPTGTCPTVGAAGLTLGGGIGIASRQYGLTCDQLASAHIVTADGTDNLVSPTALPNLYWALRGGGGGNFGIVTQLQFHTQPTTSFGFFLLSFPWSSAAAVVRGWSARMNAAPHTTWANLHLEAAADHSTSARVVGVCTAGQETAEAHAMETAIGVGASSSSLFTKTFLDAMQFLGGGTTSPRQGWAAGSDVLSHMTTPVSEALVSLIARRAASGQAGVAILDPLTGAVQAKTPMDTAFPWRRHLCDVQWYLTLPDHPTQSEVIAAYNWIATGHTAVAPVSSGGYINYLEPRRQVSTYYDGNLARLQTVRNRFDPHGVFHTAYSIPA